ncbi:hypothetical protein JHW43_000494 [Diplocarpon mali]|nr:hypothetical protein JHW43_000494 [Diplocarpon mali]
MVPLDQQHDSTTAQHHSSTTPYSTAARQHTTPYNTIQHHTTPYNTIQHHTTPLHSTPADTAAPGVLDWPDEPLYYQLPLTNGTEFHCLTRPWTRHPSHVHTTTDGARTQGARQNVMTSGTRGLETYAHAGHGKRPEDQQTGHARARRRPDAADGPPGLRVFFHDAPSPATHTSRLASCQGGCSVPWPGSVDFDAVLVWPCDERRRPRKYRHGQVYPTPSAIAPLVQSRRRFTAAAGRALPNHRTRPHSVFAALQSSDRSLLFSPLSPTSPHDVQGRSRSPMSHGARGGAVPGGAGHPEHGSEPAAASARVSCAQLPTQALWNGVLCPAVGNLVCA